ncbi:hypothetical protein ABKN59_005820 [Abortiporus biennis]
MFFNAFHVAGVLACLVAVINAAPQAAESSAPPPQVSTFRAPKVINTVLPVSPFLTCEILSDIVEVTIYACTAQYLQLQNQQSIVSNYNANIRLTWDSATRIARTHRFPSRKLRVLNSISARDIMISESYMIVFPMDSRDTLNAFYQAPFPWTLNY